MSENNVAKFRQDVTANGKLITVDFTACKVVNVRDEGGEKSGDYSTAKRAESLLAKVGLPVSWVGERLHDSLGYPIEWINGQTQIDPTTNLEGELRTSDRGFAGWSFVDRQFVSDSHLLQSSQPQNALVKSSQTLTLTVEDKETKILDGVVVEMIDMNGHWFSLNPEKDKAG